MLSKVLLDRYKDILVFHIDFEKSLLLHEDNVYEFSSMSKQIEHYVSWVMKEKQSIEFVHYFNFENRLFSRNVEINYFNSSRCEIMFHISTKVRVKDNVFESSVNKIFLELTKKIHILHIDESYNAYLLYSNNSAYCISNIGAAPNLYKEASLQFNEQLTNSINNSSEFTIDISVENKEKNGVDWSNIKLFPLLDKTGWVEKWVLFEKNINNKVNMNKELISSQKALEALDIGMWKWDIVRNYLTWDEGMYKLYEIESSSFSGAYEAWRSTLHPDWVEKTEEHLEKALLGECDYHMTFGILTGLGNKKFIEAKGNIIRDVDGRPIFMYGFNFDKTEEYHLKMEIENEKEVIHQSERMILLGEMASEIGHEINNPLGIILGYANILVNEKESFSNELEQIKKAATRIENIVRGLKTLSYAKSINEVFDLGKTVRELYLLLKDIYRLDGIEIELNYMENEVYSIFGDEGRVQQVIMNSMSNAKDALIKRENKKIKLSIYSLKSEVVVEVEDNGEGIAEEEKEKIFRPFYSTKVKGRGTGVGLSLSKNVMNEHGGRIKLGSKKGVGTIFTYIFPSIVTPLISSEVHHNQRDIIISEQCFKGKKALVVDDEVQLLNIMSNLLEDFGMEVIKFSDSVQALDHFKKHSSDFDFVLSDLRMPRVDGVEFMETILNQPLNRLPELFIITGGAIDTEISQNFKNRLSGVLHKPYHEEDILKKMLLSISYSKAS